MFKAKHFVWKWSVDLPLVVILTLLWSLIFHWTLPYTLVMLVAYTIFNYATFKIIHLLLLKKEQQ